VAKQPVRKQIKEAGLAIREVMEDHLGPIADGLVDQVMGRARRLTPAQKLKAIKDLTPQGVQAYRQELLGVLATLALEAIETAKREVPKAKKVKLFEIEPDAIKLDDIDRLPPKLQKKLKTRTDLLIGKQIGDLQKVIEFAYATAEEETDSDDMIEGDIRDSALGWLEGTAMETGANLTAATVINEARNAFFFEPDVLEEIDAFVFVNGDPVTEICQDLAGTVFSKDDPEADRYFPPLHWNCKSSIQPILKGNLGSRKVDTLKPSSKDLDRHVQFSERCSCSDD
jgi:SPP1 gp7 family putative phage head morphogenesis protein